MKILILGAAGRLGRFLHTRLLEAGHDVTGLSHGQVDVTDNRALVQAIDLHAPEALINCSSRNGLEDCRSFPAKAFQVNASAPAMMAIACKSIGALLIHFSTDYVFSGDEMGLYEDTPVRPWGVYGRTKLWGEEGVRLCAGPHFVFRLSSLYGTDLNGVLQPLKQVQDGKGVRDNPVKVLHQCCAPTSVKLVADAVAHILDRSHFTWATWGGFSGVYHLASKGTVWKTEFTRYLLDAHVPRVRELHGWLVEEGVLPEPRPIYTVLKSSLFEKTFGYELPDWKTDLLSMLPLLPKVRPPSTVEA